MDLLLLGLLVFFSYTAQAMTGFGSIVVALTAGSLFFPIRTILPVLVALNIPLCLWILYKKHSEIDVRFLLLRILPLMGTGMIVGVLLEEQLEGPVLRRLFGVLILGFSLRELYLLFFKKELRMADDTQTSRAIGSFWILTAGVIHGIYASGGPPLVHALSRMSRQAFRATLAAVWLILNGTLLGLYFLNGRFAAEESRQFLLLLPAIPPALLAGEWLHGRVSERSFRITLQGLLALSAGALLV